MLSVYIMQKDMNYVIDSLLIIMSSAISLHKSNVKRSKAGAIDCEIYTYTVDAAQRNQP